MYRIQQAAEEQWTIVDERDEVVFTGTLRGCEDWLDFQENAERRSTGNPGFWRGFLRGMRALLWFRTKSREMRGAADDSETEGGET